MLERPRRGSMHVLILIDPFPVIVWQRAEEFVWTLFTGPQTDKQVGTVKRAATHPSRCLRGQPVVSHGNAPITPKSPEELEPGMQPSVSMQANNDVAVNFGRPYSRERRKKISTKGRRKVNEADAGH